MMRIQILMLVILAQTIGTLSNEANSREYQIDSLNTTQSLWPLPKSIQSTSPYQMIQFQISDISFKIEAYNDYVQQIINHYIVNVFNLPPFHYQDGLMSANKKKNKGVVTQIVLSIVVKSSKIIVPQSVDHEQYQLNIRSNQNWELVANYYPGFVRGFETFSQLLIKSQINTQKYFIKNRPVFLDDLPDFRWRGLMIDTSRHYLPIDKIKKIVDGLMYNKMNVLHWHIIDQDSFPMEVTARLQLSKYGSLAGIYSKANIQSIINYARMRGIRVVAQYDSPAHTRSWGRSASLSQITYPGEHAYQGQFNPTINLTYQVLADVMKFVDQTFQDPYVHLGGDEVDTDVWDQHPEVKQWMKENNITSYEQLQIQYRKRERKMLYNINATKRAIYWANEQINLPVEPNDLIQWWGETSTIEQLKIHKNQIILSNYDLAYLDVGFGDQLGDPYREHISWRDIYKFDAKIQGVNAIGGEACMWAELTYAHNIQQKIWIRSSVLAERLWNRNVNINSQGILLNIVKRLIEQRKRMQSRGFKCSPVTVGLCQKSPQICFN